MLGCMRTTLTLDDDVAALIARGQKRHEAPLKKVVNEGLRYGLKQMLAPPRLHKRFKTKSVMLGRCLVERLDDVAAPLSKKSIWR